MVPPWLRDCGTPRAFNIAHSPTAIIWSTHSRFHGDKCTIFIFFNLRHTFCLQSPTPTLHLWPASIIWKMIENIGWEVPQSPKTTDPILFPGLPSSNKYRVVLFTSCQSFLALWFLNTSFSYSCHCYELFFLFLDSQYLPLKDSFTDFSRNDSSS